MVVVEEIFIREYAEISWRFEDNALVIQFHQGLN